MKKAVELYKIASKAQKNHRSKTDAEGGISNKAARLLLLMGSEEAARIMAKLTPEEAEELTRQIVKIRRVDTADAEALLDELGQHIDVFESKKVRGGIDAARRILSDAFGDAQAEEILAKSIPKDPSGPFSFLDNLTITQLINLLQKENPRTLALIMPYIDPRQASRLLKSLPSDEQTEVILRMARTQKVSREVVMTVEETLKEKLRLIGTDDSQAIDGQSVLADILRCMDTGDERRLLDELNRADSQLAEQVKMKLYTMDLVVNLRSRDLQNILRDLTEKDIAMLLKGQSEAVKDKIMGSLSFRRRLLVDEETDLLGPVVRKDADAVVQDFLARMQKGEAEGTYIIIRGDEEVYE